MHALTLEQLRDDFEMRSKGAFSMPIAGVIVWSIVAVLGYLLPSTTSVFALVFATGAIFPLALGFAQLRGEQLTSRENPLAALMGASVLMVNLLWGLHIPLLLHAPEFVPLSLGIGLGLHWIVYSWITQHGLGYRHAIFRTIGLVGTWWLFPERRVSACASAVVLAYAFTLIEMRSRLAMNKLSPAGI